MGREMEFQEVLSLCGWFFVLGAGMTFGGLFGMAVFDLIKFMFRQD